MFIVTDLIESELLCLLLRWPYGQSTMGSQYDKTTYMSHIYLFLCQTYNRRAIFQWNDSGHIKQVLQLKSRDTTAYVQYYTFVHKIGIAVHIRSCVILILSTL